MYTRWRKFGSSFDLGRMTLGDLVRAYGTHPAVHVYVVCAVASFAVAAHVGGTAAGLLASGAATLLAYPVVWYALHRFVLHSRLLYRSPLTASLWKRIHFDHHQDPHRMDVLFGSPLNTLPTMAILLLPLGGWLGGPGGAAVAFGTGLLVTCFYEFCHCIQHLNFRPRMLWLRRMKELHLAHHFHDEHGNFGITSFVVDRLLGTYYGSVRERSRSRHVFNLGYDVAQAERFPWVARLSGGPPRDRPARAGLAQAGAGQTGALRPELQRGATS